MFNHMVRLSSAANDLHNSFLLVIKIIQVRVGLMARNLVEKCQCRWRSIVDTSRASNRFEFVQKVFIRKEKG